MLSGTNVELEAHQKNALPQTTERDRKDESLPLEAFEKLPNELINQILTHVLLGDELGYLETDYNSLHCPHKLAVLHTCRRLYAVGTRILNKDVLWVRLACYKADEAFNAAKKRFAKLVCLLDIDENDGTVRWGEATLKDRYRQISPEISLSIRLWKGSQGSQTSSKCPAQRQWSTHKNIIFSYNRCGYEQLMREIQYIKNQKDHIMLCVAANKPFDKLIVPLGMCWGFCKVYFFEVCNNGKELLPLDGRTSLDRALACLYRDSGSILAHTDDSAATCLESAHKMNQQGEMLESGHQLDLARTLLEILNVERSGVSDTLAHFWLHRVEFVALYMQRQRKEVHFLLGRGVIELLKEGNEHIPVLRSQSLWPRLGCFAHLSLTRFEDTDQCDKHAIGQVLEFDSTDDNAAVFSRLREEGVLWIGLPRADSLPFSRNTTEENQDIRFGLPAFIYWVMIVGYVFGFILLFKY
ncbi:MAG: hypothetical protein Q9227_003945 [Pyrenula ochraceoflavens]